MKHEYRLKYQNTLYFYKPGLQKYNISAKL